VRYPDEPAVATVLAMLEKKLNCPRTSSAGRLFDAASGLLGLCLKMDMDAEAAIKLEQAATRQHRGRRLAAGDGRWLALDAGVLDLRPLLGELAGQRDAEQGAACSMRRWWRHWRNGLREPVRRRESKPWRLAAAVSSTVCWRSACVVNWKLLDCECWRRSSWCPAMRGWRWDRRGLLCMRWKSEMKTARDFERWRGSGRRGVLLRSCPPSSPCGLLLPLYFAAQNTPPSRFGGGVAVRPSQGKGVSRQGWQVSGSGR
jgi:hypothetical protein